jgi:hypothetical protein
MAPHHNFFGNPAKRKQIQKYMNDQEAKIAKLLLTDIEKAAEPKARFDAIIRYETFTKAVWARAQADHLGSK